jgi:hypothetical protein
MMNASISCIAAGNQLAAMSYRCFVIGILQQSGRMLLRERWSAEDVGPALKWLRSENARGAHIFVRPHGEHVLSLLDDITSSAIVELRRAGFDLLSSSILRQAIFSRGSITDRSCVEN